VPQTFEIEGEGSAYRLREDMPMYGPRWCRSEARELVRAGIRKILTDRRTGRLQTKIPGTGRMRCPLEKPVTG
jgi:hypothetical protein